MLVECGYDADYIDGLSPVLKIKNGNTEPICSPRGLDEMKFIQFGVCAKLTASSENSRQKYAFT